MLPSIRSSTRWAWRKCCACICVKIASGLSVCAGLRLLLSLNYRAACGPSQLWSEVLLRDPLASMQVLHYSESKEDQEKAGNMVKGQQAQPSTESSASKLKENAQLKKAR